MKLLDISDYNRAAKTYWMFMVAAGAVVFVWAVTRCFALTQVESGELAVLVLFAVVASSHPIRIPNTDSSFTAGDVLTFTITKNLTGTFNLVPNNGQGTVRPSIALTIVRIS